VVVVGTDKTTLSYLYNKTTNEVTLIESAPIPAVL